MHTDTLNRRQTNPVKNAVPGEDFRGGADEAGRWLLFRWSRRGGDLKEVGQIARCTPLLPIAQGAGGAFDLVRAAALLLHESHKIGRELLGNDVSDCRLAVHFTFVIRELLLVDFPRRIGIEFLEDLLELCLADTCRYTPSGRKSTATRTRDASVMAGRQAYRRGSSCLQTLRIRCFRSHPYPQLPTC